MTLADIRICFFGDSYVNGTDDPECLGWCGRLVRSSQSGITYYNLGVRGDTSANIAARWQDEASKRLPSNTRNVLVFSFGTNDTVIENGQPRIVLADTLNHAEAIFRHAPSIASTLFVGPPALSEPHHHARNKDVNDALQDLAARYAIGYVDILSALTNDTAWHAEISANDGYHPSAYGYNSIAELVRQSNVWRDVIGEF